MGKSLLKITVMVVVVLFSVVLGVEISQADAITLYNTGVDDSNAVLSDGAADLHYTITSSPGSYGTAYVANNGVYPLGIWILNTSVSKWITPAVNTNQSLAVGNYTYTTTFDLSGMDPTTANISGNWTTDNQGVDIFINGISTSNTIAFGTPGNYSFQSLHAFAIATGFQNGINILDFVLTNEGGPTGLRVELTGTANPVGTSVPEPSTLLLLGSGLLGLVGYGRRRAKK